MAQQYSNRTDLQNPAKKIAAQAATGQPYGQAGQQIAAQKAVPMASAPTETVPAPGSFGPLDKPSERPSEPITAGMDFGAGPGPEVLAMPNNNALGSKADLIQRVRAAVAAYPNPNLIQLLLVLEGQ